MQVTACNIPDSLFILRVQVQLSQRKKRRIERSELGRVRYTYVVEKDNIHDVSDRLKASTETHGLFMILK